MSTPQHTPGDWRASADGTTVYSCGNHLVCTVAPRKVASQQAHNARFIATAPQMAARIGELEAERERLSQEIERLVERLQRFEEDAL